MAVPWDIVCEQARRMGQVTDIRRGEYEWRDGDDRTRYGESISYRIDGVAHVDTYHRQGDPMMFERFYFLLDVRTAQAEQRQMDASVADAIRELATRSPGDERELEF